MIGNGVVVDPAVLLAELDSLRPKGSTPAAWWSAATPT
jgi:adenylosuccinate synthase